MKTPERQELQRQGAKAAARGESAHCNPLLHHRNRPAATGEATPLWSARCAAWQAGFEAQCRDAGRRARRSRAP